MRKILSGIETEYGFLIEGRGAENQVEDAMALVRGYPGECLPIWDYRYESPRSDLRGFKVRHLTQDPEDAKFDIGKTYGSSEDIRSDRILPNGARFYNDHGHPEYSTPECWSLSELAAHDQAGMLAVLDAGQALSAATGKSVHLYKNNTDFHGASYGTHENYLVPRSIGFDGLYPALLPMLIARQILTGAGKVGQESGPVAEFQLSQRADFFMEPVNAETLYRRPIFNTRDEPHARPGDWIRLHVISGDANMIPDCTALKVGLVKLAIHLAENGTAPQWAIGDPVRAFQQISRDSAYEFRVQLERQSWTTGYEILESYFAAAEHTLDLDGDMQWVIDTSRQLLTDLRGNFDRFRRQVDWAAKRAMLVGFVESEGTNWDDPLLRSFDLEYHNIDPDSGLWYALRSMDEVASGLDDAELRRRLAGVLEPTRAYARGLAVSKFGKSIHAACWRTLTFDVGDEFVEVELLPDREYSPELDAAPDVETFIEVLGGQP